MQKDLTAGEVSNLWSSYMANTMAVYVIRYFLNTNDDRNIHKMLKYAEEIAVEGGPR